MKIKGKITILGAGSMGGALLRGWIKAKRITASQVMAVDLDVEKLKKLSREINVKTSKDIDAAIPGSSLVLLAVKPQQLKTLLETSGSRFPAKALVVSIAAGVSTGQIESNLLNGNPVVRVMPNAPSLLGEGMAAVATGKRASRRHVKMVMELFKAVGKVVEVSEDQMDLVTALSGSGPAYVYYLIEALVEAGIANGMDRAIAQTLAVQTVLGAARMVSETGREPVDLRAQVTSPGGTTQAALAVLESKDFKGTIRAVVEAAVWRSSELRKMNS